MEFKNPTYFGRLGTYITLKKGYCCYSSDAQIDDLKQWPSKKCDKYN